MPKATITSEREGRAIFFANTAQKLALRKWRERVDIDERQWSEILDAMRVRSAHELTHEQASWLIQRMARQGDKSNYGR